MHGRSRKYTKEEELKKITRYSVLVSLYILCGFLSIKLGNIRITLGSFPIYIGAILYGSQGGAIVGLCGEFINQLLTYGISYTTPMWIIPPMIRGYLIGKLNIDNRLYFYLGNIIISIFITFINTLVIFIDSILFGYYTPAYVLGAFGIRIIAGIVTSIIVSTLSMMIIKRLEKL